VKASPLGDEDPPIKVPAPPGWGFCDGLVVIHCESCMSQLHLKCTLICRSPQQSVIIHKLNAFVLYVNVELDVSSCTYQVNPIVPASELHILCGVINLVCVHDMALAYRDDIFKNLELNLFFN